MNPRIAGILLVLLLVLGGAALLYEMKDRDSRPASAPAAGQRLFKDLKAADIAALRFTEGKQTLTVQRKGEEWVIPERGGFPADVATVREFVLKAIELKAPSSEPLGEKDRARLNLDASGTLVEFLGADGKPLARMLAGRKYFKREVEDPQKALGDGRFVLLPDDPSRVYVVSDPLTQAAARSANWIDRTGIKVEKVGTLEVTYPDGSGYRIERSGDNADWKLAGAKPGEKLDIPRANAASYSLGLLQLSDVAPKDVQDTGLDAPTVVQAATLAGAKYVIKVGRLAGEDHYVRFEPAAGDAREKRLAEHVLLIAKSKLEDTLKKRAELLEKKEDTKK